MSLNTILFAGIAATTLSSPVLLTAARASDDTYLCNDQRCYDDQSEETRRLNILQAEHPGAGVHAVPGYNGPAFDDQDRNGDSDRDVDGYRNRDDDRNFGSDDDRAMSHDREHYDGRMPSGDDRPDADDDSDDKQ